MNLPTFAAALAMGSLVWAGPTAPTSNPVPAKKTATTAVKRPVAAKPAVASASAKRVVKKPAVAVSHTSWRNRQASPTSDRYREIQQALVDRGYLSADNATGAWSTASVDAMKKFQAEQTLETTGKIDSLSLIALGLGPKHDSTPIRVVDGAVQPELAHN